MLEGENGVAFGPGDPQQERAIATRRALEVERLKRMVSDASDEDIAIIKMFFHTMNSWFLRKIERLQYMFPNTPNSPSGIYERSRVVESRPAEKV